MRKLIAVGLILVLSGLAACRKQAAEDRRFETLAREYLDRLLELDPELATSLGEHRFDHRLKDHSRRAVEGDIQFNRHYLEALSSVNASELGTEDRIDYEILRDRIQARLYSLETLREYEWNPLTYNVGNSLYLLMEREFAPLQDRMRNVLSRLKELPSVLAAAQANLQNPPRLHVETAILQNKGNLNLVRTEMNAFLDKVPELKPEFTPVQFQAASALEDYGNWLEKDLMPRAHGDFRIGPERFRQKLRYTLESDRSVEEILHRAQNDLKAIQEAMHGTALSLYRKLHPHVPEKMWPKDPRVIIKNVLDKLGESHPDNQTILGLAEQDLQEATGYVHRAQLVTVPVQPLRIVAMPEFRRGVVVAYCESPGALETQAEALLAISPTPADWPAERVASFFREYNSYMLQDLIIHEAMPGHYLQLAHSNQFKAPTRVRAIFSSGTFVEGWATYAEQVMVDRGYGGPEVKMQQLKMRLRMIINAMLDQKVHTGNMTEREAMALMKDEGFQEEAEAVGKWRRACLTSTQLSTYYVGNLEINDIKRAYEDIHGAIEDVKAYHDKLLSYGSPAPKYVRQLMGL